MLTELLALGSVAVKAFVGGEVVSPVNTHIRQEKPVASASSGINRQRKGGGRPVDLGRVCLGPLSDCGTPTPPSAIINEAAGYNNPTPKPGEAIKCIVEERCDRPPVINTRDGSLGCLGMMVVPATLAAGLAFQRKLKQRNHKRKFRYY